jgi:cyclopropane fatty-acyl-phospholipid synthase-like methyltransferase
MQSPLTGSTDCTRVYTIRGADLVELYRWQSGLDISDEVDAEEITLWYDPVADFHFFDPPCAGSEKFYRERPGNHPYRVEKQEYRFGASHLSGGDRLLDVGCGWGHFADYVHDVNYTGVELSETAVAHCRNKGLDVSRQFVHEIAEEFPDGFDVVASFQVLEHLENPREFFADCVRCVRPQGKLIISVPNADSFMSVRENNYLNYPPHHITWWTLTSLLYLAREHGLTLVASYVDRAEGNELAMHYGAALHSILRRGVRRGIRNQPQDRALLKLCDGLGKFARLIPAPDALAPHGHSITVALSKP